MLHLPLRSVDEILRMLFAALTLGKLEAAMLPIVPPADVIPVAERTSATPYDVPGVELSHVGDGCSFDAFVSKYGRSATQANRLRV